MESVYHITGVNPQPWVAPNFSGVGKAKRAFTSETLRTYKSAVAEELPLQNAHATLLPKGTLVTARFYLWRQLESWEGGHSMIADATNCQKALEDALQGILYVNDQSNRDVRTAIVEQEADTEPHIMIIIEKFTQLPLWLEVAKYPRPFVSDKHLSNINEDPNLF